MTGKLISYEVNDSDITIIFEYGKGCIRVVKEDIIRVLCPLEMQEIPSKAIEGDKRQKTEFTVEMEETVLTLRTPALLVKIYDEFFVDFYTADGSMLCSDYREKRVLIPRISERMKKLMQGEGHNAAMLMKESYPVQVVKKMDGDEKFYGLGDKPGFLNKRGYDFENWNTSDPHAQTEAFKALYKSIPFFITLKEKGVYGLFFDNSYKSYVDFGRENSSYFFYGAEGGNLDYYFIGGKKMTEVVANYTYLTGTTPLPQLWTLGYHQSRFGYESAEDIREVAENFRKYQVPCNVIHFDIDYMDGFRVFTWNAENFEKPGALTSELEKKGYRTVTIVDPGVKFDPGYSVYDEGIAGDFFVRDANGDVYINTVWSGETVFPDYGRQKVRDWWGEKQKYLVDIGTDGIWNDMNEPRSFRSDLPDDVQFYDGDRKTNHAEMHNVYGHLMSKASYEGLMRAEEKRPFVITRACYAGTQKYATVWTGDNHSLWAHLQMAVPQLLNLGISGFSFAGTDVGGFGSDCTPELLCRWVQVGAFSPLFRNHSSKGTIRQEPWQFDEETLAINKKFIELRYRLLPYFYDLCHECEETGLPIMRPVVLHYEDDRETWNLNGEFLVGEHMLVAPVLEQGAVKKTVYLPAGVWYDFFTGKPYEGRQYYLLDAPLDTCPVFVKEGSIIPTYEVLQYVGERPYDTLKLLIFPGEGCYVHYQDNGIDFAYRKGEYNLYEFRSDGTGTVRTEMLHEGYRTYKAVETIAITEQDIL